MGVPWKIVRKRKEPDHSQIFLNIWPPIFGRWSEGQAAR
jgi:hypothetical protein